MKLGLINSAWAQAGRDTAFGIRMTKEIGFDTIDIFADPLDIDVKERRLIKARMRPGRPADRQHRLRGRRPDRLQPQRAALPPAALPGLPRPGLRVRGQEPAAGAGRVHLGDSRSSRRRSNGRPASATSANWASTPPTSACRSPWSWSRSSCRWSTTWTAWCRFLDDVDHPAVRANIDVRICSCRRTPPEELRRLQGQGDPRPPQRLRRQGPRRPAAGPRRRRFRARTCARSRPWASTGR